MTAVPGVFLLQDHISHVFKATHICLISVVFSDYTQNFVYTFSMDGISQFIIACLFMCLSSSPLTLNTSGARIVLINSVSLSFVIQYLITTRYLINTMVCIQYLDCIDSKIKC